jgi:Ca2+-binding RTX toxin-like protein
MKVFSSKFHIDFMETCDSVNKQRTFQVSDAYTFYLLDRRRQMVLLVGSDSDNFLTGTANKDTIKGKAGNDTLEGLGAVDTLVGGKNDDYIFAGAGADILSGDGDSITIGNNGSINIGSAEKGNDVLVGGTGTDLLVAWGDDTLVGGGPGRYNAQLISDLQNDPFSTSIARDRVRDTFVALNKDAIDYTLTVVDYEVGIDRIDLRGFGVSRASDFEEIQDKGSFFEAKTPEINGGELVLRINVNPTSLTYIV